jgi:hypothetical protein
MSRNALNILAVILMLAFRSSYAHAGGATEKMRCPKAKEGKEDGNGGGRWDKFTFESFVDEDKNNGGSHFRRCIENQADKTIWTHWVGVLSNGRIPKGERLYGTTFVTKGEVAPRQTYLFWGDNRDKKEIVEAKCFKGEEFCGREKEQYGLLQAGALYDRWRSFGDRLYGASFFVSAAGTSQDLGLNNAQEIGAYREFFVPVVSSSCPLLTRIIRFGRPRETLVKFALEVTSRFTGEYLDYSAVVYVSHHFRELDNSYKEGVVFRLSGKGVAAKALGLEGWNFTSEQSPEGARLEAQEDSVTIKRERVKTYETGIAEMTIDVLNGSGEVVASIPVAVLQGR